MTKIKPILSVLASACFWGLMSIFVRRLGDSGMDPFDISLVRVLFAALFILILIMLRSPKLLKIDLRDLWMFIGTGLISLSFFNWCYFTVISRGDVSVAVVLLYTSPIWVMLLSALFFKEKITPVKLIAVVLTFGGCILVSGISGSHGISPYLLFLGIMSGIGYSMYSIIGRVALRKYNSYTLTFYTFVFSFIGMIFLSDWKSVISKTIETPSLLLWEIGIGVICAGIPYFLYTWGLERLETSHAAVYATFEPIVGAIVGITVFHESASPVRLLGFALIIGSSVLLALCSKPAKAPETAEVTEGDG